MAEDINKEEKITPEGEQKPKETKKKKKEPKVNPLQKEVDELKDVLLRTSAEYENYRKRTAKEKEQLRASVISDTVSDFVPVIDNLGYARDSLSKQEGVDVSGIEMVIKQFTDILSGLGVYEIEAEGKSFDPNLMNAVMHEENPDLPENTVSQVLQKGYIIGERVIRHAMVKVAN